MHLVFFVRLKRGKRLGKVLGDECGVARDGTSWLMQRLPGARPGRVIESLGPITSVMTMKDESGGQARGDTGRRKGRKERNTYLLSAIPANALYQAKKADRMPKPPPA
jgi:hypothetical protein